MNLLREPDAGDPHVRFDERAVETERSYVTAPPLDSTLRASPHHRIVLIGDFSVLRRGARERAAPFQPDTSATRLVTLGPATWSYVPAPADVALTRDPIAAGLSSGENGRLADSIFTGDTSVDIQFKTSTRRSASGLAGSWSVDRYDLKTGAKTGPIPLPTDLFAFAFTDDGARAAVSGKDVHSANSGTLYIVDFDKMAARTAFCFVPYAAEGRDSRQIAWARFVDKGHLLTSNEMKKRIVLWNPL